MVGVIALALAAPLALFLLVSAVVILGIAWAHYPCGVRGRRKPRERA